MSIEASFSIPFLNRKKEKEAQKEDQLIFADKAPVLFILHSFVRGKFSGDEAFKEAWTRATTRAHDTYLCQPTRYLLSGSNHDRINGTTHSLTTPLTYSHAELVGTEAIQMKREFLHAAEEAYDYAMKVIDGNHAASDMRSKLQLVAQKIFPAALDEKKAPPIDPHTEAYNEIRSTLGQAMNDTDFAREASIPGSLLSSRIRSLAWQKADAQRARPAEKRKKKTEINMAALEEIEQVLSSYRKDAITRHLKLYAHDHPFIPLTVRDPSDNSLHERQPRSQDSIFPIPTLDYIDTGITFQFYETNSMREGRQFNLLYYGLPVSQLHIGKDKAHTVDLRRSINGKVMADFAAAELSWSANDEMTAITSIDAVVALERVLQDGYIEQCFQKINDIELALEAGNPHQKIKELVGKLQQCIQTFGISREEMFQETELAAKRALDILSVKYIDRIPQNEIEEFNFNNNLPASTQKEKKLKEKKFTKERLRSYGIPVVLMLGMLFIARQTDTLGKALESFADNTTPLVDPIRVNNSNSELAFFAGREASQNRILAKIEAFNGASIPRLIAVTLSSEFDESTGAWKPDVPDTVVAVSTEFTPQENQAYLTLTDYVFVEDHRYQVPIPVGHAISSIRLTQVDGGLFTGYQVYTHANGTTEIRFNEGEQAQKLSLTVTYTKGMGVRAVEKVKPINPAELSKEAQEVITGATSVEEIAEKVKSPDNHRYSVLPHIPSGKATDVINEIESNAVADCETSATETLLLSTSLPDKTAAYASGFSVTQKGSTAHISTKGGHAYVVTEEGTAVDPTPIRGEALDEETKAFFAELDAIDDMNAEELEAEWNVQEENTIPFSQAKHILQIAAACVGTLAFVRPIKEVVQKIRDTQSETPTRIITGENSTERESLSSGRRLKKVFELKDEWIKLLRTRDKGDKYRLTPMIKRFTGDLFRELSLLGYDSTEEQRAQAIDAMKSRLDYWKSEWRDVAKVQRNPGFKEGLELRRVRDLLKRRFMQGSDLTLEPEEEAARARDREIDKLRNKYNKVLGPYANLHEEALRIISDLENL